MRLLTLATAAQKPHRGFCVRPRRAELLVLVIVHHSDLLVCLVPRVVIILSHKSGTSSLRGEFFLRKKGKGYGFLLTQRLAYAGRSPLPRASQPYHVRQIVRGHAALLSIC